VVLVSEAAVKPPNKAMGHDEVRLLYLKPDEAAMELGEAATLVLFTWEEARGDEFARHLKDLMKKQRVKGVLVVGLVGGTDRAWRALRKARPMLTQVKVGQVHIDDNGQIRSRNAGPVKKALADFERTSPPSEQEWARFRDKNAAAMADYAGREKTATEFAALLSQERALALLPEESLQQEFEGRLALYKSGEAYTDE